ncbi:MAG: protein kinase, partial [Pseudomonas sp.]|nr:protein kinase [Pseudomonas sp.]
MPTVLGKRYRIERLLGAGGMGTVYRARDLLHEQFADPQPCVALKVLSEAYEHSTDASALLFNEFALIRHLRHPNVLRVYSFEVDTEHERVFMVMELLRGPTLDRLLCERPLGMAWH